MPAVTLPDSHPGASRRTTETTHHRPDESRGRLHRLIDRLVRGSCRLAALPRRVVRSIPGLAGSLVRRLPAGVRRRVIHQVGARRWLVGAYYLCTGEYAREQRATFVGRLAHLAADSELGREELRYGLRRSIHRLEKGLLMRPRRAVFAESFIEEAVRQYQLVGAHETAVEDALLLWARDVLRKYFEVAGSTKRIEDARSRFRNGGEQGGTAVAGGQAPRLPYLRDETPLRMTIDDLRQLARRRCSVRWYRPEPVPRAAIDQAIDVARQSPSACNRQPFDFRIFDDPTMVRQVAAVPMGTRGYQENIPVVAVLVGHQRAFPYGRDRHLIYIDAGLAAMAFQFALEVQGIGSCSINWPEIPERENSMSELLGLRADERPVMLIALGYPDQAGLVAYSEKKTIDELRTYNQLRGAG